MPTSARFPRPAPYIGPTTLAWWVLRTPVLKLGRIPRPRAHDPVVVVAPPPAAPAPGAPRAPVRLPIDGRLFEVLPGATMATVYEVFPGGQRRRLKDPRSLAMVVRYLKGMEPPAAEREQ